jgi:hypothetical protein
MYAYTCTYVKEIHIHKCITQGTIHTCMCVIIYTHLESAQIQQNVNNQENLVKRHISVLLYYSFNFSLSIKMKSWGKKKQK